MAESDLLKALQDDLIIYYKHEVPYIPISPLVPEHQVTLVDLYVQPKLVILEKSAFGYTSKTPTGKQTHFYKDIFFDDNKKLCKHIFVLAEAGVGKTSFARKMTYTWCQAVNQDKTLKDKFNPEDIETMKQFDFLFLLSLSDFLGVSLPDSKGEPVCDLNDLIFLFVSRNLSRSSQYSKALLETVLREKRCLVIMDGLDQWSHPADCRRKTAMPHNRHSGSCTVLTTTRPWKLSKVSSSQIDRCLKIADLTRRAAQELEKKAIKKLKGFNDDLEEDDAIDEFDRLLKAAGIEDEVRFKPHVLLMFVCLFADGVPIGNSKCKAYSNLVEFALKRGQSGNIGPYRMLDTYRIPDCMQSYEFCKNFFILLLKLGDIAFNALSNKSTSGSVTCIDDNTVSKFLDKNEMDFFLRSGMITVDKDTSLVSKSDIIVSFLDRSLQEFLSALYIVSVWDIWGKKKDILQQCWSMDIADIANISSLVKDMDTHVYGDLSEKIKSGRITDVPEQIMKSHIGHTAPRNVSFYGSRLVPLVKREAEGLVRDCIEENKIGIGAFGKVFKSSALSENYGIIVAVKKIDVTKEKEAQIRDAVRKELYVSNVLHPFLMPTIAVLQEVAKQQTSFYFITPYFVSGDLCSVLHPKQTRSDLNQVGRIRTVFQIAEGLQYLHTAIPGVRDAIMHRDICSQNIVLDDRYNARLIDFGLAKIKDDDRTPTSATPAARIYYSHPDMGTKGKQYIEEWDFFSFGVVIRELLTSLYPWGTHETYLKIMKEEEIKENFDKDIWPKSDPDSIKASDGLNQVASSCLAASDKNRLNVKENVINRIRGLIEGSVWISEENKTEDKSKNAKCALCLVNDGTSAAAGTMHCAANCEENLSICIPCEKRSFKFPVTCYSCKGVLQPTIGTNWGAVLVAGNDTSDREVAEVFKRDVQNMKQILTSTAPVIMGIREDRIKVIDPKTAGKEDLLISHVESAIKAFKSTDVNTLVFYCTCHGKEDRKFLLGSNTDVLDAETLEQWLEELIDAKVKKFIIFLDRCHPPEINPNRKKQNSEVQTIQINPCKEEHKADIKNNYSKFTKYLVQGLQAKAEKKRIGTCSNYISAQMLHKYTSEDMGNDQKQPIFQCSGKFTHADFRVAYYTSEEVEVFFQDEETQSSKHLYIDLVGKMEDLESELVKEFDRKDISAVKIEKETYKRSNNREACKCIQDVLTAKLLGQQLFVKFIGP